MNIKFFKNSKMKKSNLIFRSFNIRNFEIPEYRSFYITLFKMLTASLKFDASPTQFSDNVSLFKILLLNRQIDQAETLTVFFSFQVFIDSHKKITHTNYQII